MINFDIINLPFNVQHLGYFRDGKILFPKCGGEYEGIEWCMEGSYIREDGEETFKLESESCNFKTYLIKKPLAFVFYQSTNKYDLDKIKSNIISEIGKIGVVTSFSRDKETILKSEKMNENVNQFLKIKFYVEYTDNGTCDPIDCNC